MSQETQNIQEQLSWRRVIIPVIIGIGVSVYLLVSALREPYFRLATEGEKPT
ncbi:MAG: hypothetical protein HRT74_00720, partial [Flavobacteriales bacterium]|nr:hypothetical protein [Flavobacteriales bacterium]